MNERNMETINMEVPETIYIQHQLELLKTDKFNLVNFICTFMMCIKNKVCIDKCNKLISLLNNYGFNQLKDVYTKTFEGMLILAETYKSYTSSIVNKQKQRLFVVDKNLSAERTTSVKNIWNKMFLEYKNEALVFYIKKQDNSLSFAKLFLSEMHLFLEVFLEDKGIFRYEILDKDTLQIIPVKCNLFFVGKNKQKEWIDKTMEEYAWPIISIMEDKLTPKEKEVYSSSDTSTKEIKGNIKVNDSFLVNRKHLNYVPVMSEESDTTSNHTKKTGYTVSPHAVKEHIRRYKNGKEVVIKAYHTGKDNSFNKGVKLV